MSGKLDAFLKEGLTKYVEAKAVVETFEKEVQLRIRSALEARHNWGLLERPRIKSDPPGGEAGYGRWISTYISGSTKAGQEVDIDLGVWWDAPHATSPVIVYASFWKKPRELLTFRFQGGGGITAYASDKVTILQSAAPEDCDFGPVLNAELDVLLAQLAIFEKTKAGRARTK